MSKKIPEEVIEAVGQLSIRQVIEDIANVDFNSRGFSQSPFRTGDSETTSFSVSDSKNLFTDWKLKPQGYSGGPIKFVQLYQKVTFVEAVLELAGKYGIMTAEELSKYAGRKVQVVEAKPIRMAPQSHNAEKAPIERIDKVYRKILELCPLTAEDRQTIRGRGFTDKEIDDAKFFTLPNRIIVRKLEEAGFTQEDFDGVPGFYKYKEDDKRFTFNAATGIGLPVFNQDGMLVGLQRRARSVSPNGSRYGWISSSSADGITKKGEQVFGYHGVGPGAPIDYKKKGSRLAITEGIFKSISLLREEDWDFSVASVQGVGNWKGIDDILKLHSEAVIIYDADLVTNDMVIQQVSLLANYIYGITGNKAKVMYWKKEYGKGIDDVLFSGNKSKVFELFYDEWADIYTAAKAIQASEGISFEDAFNRFFN